MRPGRPGRRAALRLALLLAPVCAAQTPEIQIVPSFAAAGRLGAESGFQLKLSRPLAEGEGRLAVFVGVADWSAVMTPAEGELRTSAGAPRLPVGPTEVVVYRVSARGQWVQLARFPVRVSSGRPFEKAQVKPSLAINLTAQVRESHSPPDNEPERARYEDVDGQFTQKTEHLRGDFRAASELKLLGTSHRPKALRFNSLAENAPLVDLGGYALDLRSGPFSTRLGDLKYGTHPQLLGGFMARGASLRVALGKRADVTLAGLSGSRLVGWDNPLGLDTPEHRLVAASLGIELARARPGGLRLELTGLDASVLPIASYNQGVVNDAETSSGYGLRLVGGDPKGRFHLDTGYAASRFSNPADEQLAQGTALVPVREENRSSYYLQSSLAVLRALKLSPTKTLALSVGYQQEQVAPLFRSVGVPQLQADRLSRLVSANLSVGEITLQASHQHLEDNLDDVPSILKTFTRQTAVALNLPVTALGSGQPSFWRPLVTYAFGRTSQFGGSLPENSDFSASHVPDQVSTNHTAGLQWQGQRFGLGYALNHSFQDNRQTGRETADLANTTHGVTAAFALDDKLELGLDLGRERSETLQTSERSGLRRAGLTLSCRLRHGFGLQALAAQVWSDAQNGGEGAANLEADLTAYWNYEFRTPTKRPQLKFYVRWTTQRARPELLPGSPADERNAWQIFTGLNLIAF